MSQFKVNLLDRTFLSMLQRSSVTMGQVKIQGVTTCMYLCMDVCGIPYASREFTDECVFNEMIEEHHYNTYSSAKYSNTRRTLYLAMNKRGQPRRVLIRSGSPLGKLSTYTRVLTQSVEPSEIEATKHGKTVCLPATSDRPERPRCRMRQRRPRRRKKKRPCLNKDGEQRCHHESSGGGAGTGGAGGEGGSRTAGDDQQQQHQHQQQQHHHRRIPPLRRKCEEGDEECILRRILIGRKRKSRLEGPSGGGRNGGGVRVRHRKHRTAVRLKEDEEHQHVDEHMEEGEDDEEDVTMTTEDEMILDDQSDLFLYHNENY
ncbi:fibroblast growth factor branchless isoform X2 [Rhodnius prolixus]|uniref:fibroblast growth factor branchless isoform X2 n=1 Tax=Rhodnius prolixus TaxID=13249 RepID=UPI003D188C81